MVRHECAEALGAIGDASSLVVLEACQEGDVSEEVGQTCGLALDYIRWKLDNNNKDDNGDGDDDAPAVCACMLSPYNSHDPAPPHPAHASLTASQIGLILCDDTVPLFRRFRAMFSLRNRGTEECVHELGRALVDDTSSALLRHEVAYVLGQMQHPSSVEYLATSLRRKEEHEMVRHESAEALGAVEERWGDCEEVLREFLEDENEVVRESCLVALDAAGREQENEDDNDDAVKEGDARNFSLHKARSDGKADRENGVLHNHFNIAA